MLVASGQIGTIARLLPWHGRPAMRRRKSAGTPSATLVLCRDRWPHLFAGLAGALSFPLMVLLSIGSGLPFGIASALSVAYLAAATPHMGRRDMTRLMRVISSLSGIWAGSCIAGTAAGFVPAIFGLEASAAVLVTAVPFAARALVSRQADLVAMTGVEMACVETYAAGEAVIVVDPAGRILGSTWAARKAIGVFGQDNETCLLQLVHHADRQPLAAAMATVAQEKVVESCVVRFIEDCAAEPGMITLRPAAFGRLAVVLSVRQSTGLRRGFQCPDPIRIARSDTQERDRIAAQVEEVSRSGPGIGVDIREAVAFSVRLVRRDADRMNVTIESADACEDITIAIDRRSLVQVIVNLLGNAIKFSNHCGHVSIAVRKIPGAALVRISDNGIGIAAEDQERIFSFRGRAGDGSHQGHGLGLAIVRDIVENAGGSIVLSSEPGCGTTVDVRLPLADGHNATVACADSTDNDRSWQVAAE